ncbi:hypothetical protein CN311_23515 [Mesorhizobium sanjuanii]|uniref:Uncharacterized protein n=1 Tax=Mesorhizobium sanjuanii TaxID=2037900 RepID=A0A2A6FB61_9HYPH|nr:hypothetical protein CN311_23515 [Mesorhizobium sanjuanii]
MVPLAGIALPIKSLFFFCFFRFVDSICITIGSTFLATAWPYVNREATSSRNFDPPDVLDHYLPPRPMFFIPMPGGFTRNMGFVDVFVCQDQCVPDHSATANGRNLASLISTSPSEVNEGISISERCECSNYGHRQKRMYAALVYDRTLSLI